MKVRSSEYLLLAAVAEVAVRTVKLSNLVLFRWCTCLLFLGFVQIVVDPLSNPRIVNLPQFYGYTWKLSCSLTIFYHVLYLFFFLCKRDSTEKDTIQ